MTVPGQPAFEIGRNIVRNNDGDFTHFNNWLVLEKDCQIVEAFN